MKKKAIEKIKPPKASRTKKGFYTKVQFLDWILIFNVYYDLHLRCRHCFNVQTFDYATYWTKKGTWTNEKIERAYNVQKAEWYYYEYWSDEDYFNMRLEKEDERDIVALLESEEITVGRYEKSVIETISRLEMEYGIRNRERTENNRLARVNEVMGLVPMIPAGIDEWIDNKATGGMNYCLKDRKTGMWGCSSCGEEFDRSKIKFANLKMKSTKTKESPKDRDMVRCPKCKAEIQLFTRKQKVEMYPHFCMIQPINNNISVARHFSAGIGCRAGYKKKILIREDVRIILFKKKPLEKNSDCDIYYEQWPQSPSIEIRVGRPTEYIGCFDNKRNPGNKREYVGYLYDGGIEEAFKDTAYEPWTRLFTEWSAAGLSLDYNRMMRGYRNTAYRDVMEMLFRGRFYKLLQEESENVSLWDGYYYGSLTLDGNCIEEVFNIVDRQKINRIRDKNGGRSMVKWMQWSNEKKQKISDKALTWLEENRIDIRDLEQALEYYSIEQAMNYFERQRKESYKKMSVKGVINQWEDYMSMCRRLKKDTNDAMVYRPRELKRRHDEAVAEIELMQAQLQADEYSKRYPEAEKVLQSIKEKFEYSGTEYFIMVPNRIVDIVSEGRLLHHCVGSTDRYFDRIKQHETYICFMRKKEEPEKPFYTIEVEPGGTIRQHRGEFDEEPELETVKPFLKEWQKEIRKRMSKEDHKLAEISKVKRQENIDDLIAKNNTRVLEGLLEDFMEAAG